MKMLFRNDDMIDCKFFKLLIVHGISCKIVSGCFFYHLALVLHNETYWV